jgi:molybdenum cofactor guanylyltransferase
MKFDVTAVILAGGQASRMGGQDKGLLPIQEKSLIEYVLAVIEPQVSQVIISANRHLADYQTYGYPVVKDDNPGYPGPLAGILAAMKHATTPDLICVPCDTPWLPKSLVARLINARTRENADIAIAHDGDRLQTAHALIPTHLSHSIQAYLDHGKRKLQQWYQHHRWISVDFSDLPNAFTNINTPEEWRRLIDALGG